MEDYQLIREYAEHHSEKAFAELVARHFDLVYSSALRLVGETHLARDVAQMVFIDLARKPQAIRNPRALAGWLYQTARFKAASSLRTEHRRRQWERTAVEMSALHSESQTLWPALAPHLDAAMDTLDPADHDAVTLRFFKGKSLREVGQALGTSEDAAQKRMSRALEKLRAYFAQQGIAASSTLIASVIAANAVAAAPAGLAATVAATSLAAAAGGGTAALVLKLVGVMTTNLKIAIAAVLLLAAVSTPILLSHRARAPSPSESAGATKPEPSRPEPAASSAAGLDRQTPSAVGPIATSSLEVVPGTATITVQARGDDGAQPLGAGCNIETWSQVQPLPTTTDGPLRPTVTGADGDWVIYNVGPGRWSIMVSADGFAHTQEANAKHLEVREVDQVIDATTNHRTGKRDWKPVEVRAGENALLSFTLLRGVTLTGRVIAADTGQPIEGATVAGGAWNRCRDTTDADGRFAVKHLAPGEGVTARGNGYVEGPSRSVKVEEGQTVAVPDIVLQRGGWISGRVVRPPDAPEGIRTDGNVFPKFEGRLPEGCAVSSEQLKPDGTFLMGPLPPGSYTLKALLSTGKSLNRSGSWRGEMTGIRVEIGKETKDIVIEVSP